MEVWSRANCPACSSAKRLLDAEGVTWIERRADRDDAHRRRFQRATDGARTVPQIVIDGECLGGYDDLQRALASGALHLKLGREPPHKKKRWKPWRRDEPQRR